MQQSANRASARVRTLRRRSCSAALARGLTLLLACVHGGCAPTKMPSEQASAESHLVESAPVRTPGSDEPPLRQAPRLPSIRRHRGGASRPEVLRGHMYGTFLITSPDGGVDRHCLSAAHEVAHALERSAP